MEAIEMNAVELYALILALRRDIQDPHEIAESIHYRQNLLTKLLSLWNAHPEPGDTFVLRRKPTPEEVEERKRLEQQAIDESIRRAREQYGLQHPVK